MENLLTEIEEFCGSCGMSLSEFGEQAMGDRGFVFGLKRGRQCFPATISRVKSFISNNSSAQKIVDGSQNEDAA